MSATVLIVDDEVMLREALGEALQDVGYDVVQASNGEEALLRMRSQALPAVVLLDLTMPVMDGFQFRAAQRLDPALACVPVVAFTAATITERVDGLGAAAVLRKPVSLNLLLETLGRVCGPPR